MARVLLMAAESHLGCLALFAQRLRQMDSRNVAIIIVMLIERTRIRIRIWHSPAGGAGNACGRGPIDFYVMCLPCDFT